MERTRELASSKRQAPCRAQACANLRPRAHYRLERGQVSGGDDRHLCKPQSSFFTTTARAEKNLYYKAAPRRRARVGRVAWLREASARARFPPVPRAVRVAARPPCRAPQPRAATRGSADRLSRLAADGAPTRESTLAHPLPADAPGRSCAPRKPAQSTAPLALQTAAIPYAHAATSTTISHQRRCVVAHAAVDRKATDGSATAAAAAAYT